MFPPLPFTASKEMARCSQAAERQQYHDRRAAGLCTRCGRPVLDGLSRCAPCTVIDEASRSPERKNERSRTLYAVRRARGLCTSCGAPSQGAARCVPCAEKSYHRSDHFRGIPVWDSSFTVIELATGVEHGPFDSEADVSLCLAFTKLARDQVEVLCDASPMCDRLNRRLGHTGRASWTAFADRCLRAGAPDTPTRG